MDNNKITSPASVTGEAITDGPIIVNGVDVKNFPVSQITKEIATAMTDSQRESYLVGKTAQDRKDVNYLAGIAQFSMMLTDEERKKREAARNGGMGALDGTASTSVVENTPIDDSKVPTQQTGSVIFGVRK